MKIHTTIKAQKDLENIYIYSFKEWGEKQADKYFDELDYSINKTLLQNPRIGTTYDHVRSGYRQYQINEHMVFYKITSDKIYIIRVLHKSMRFEKYL
ncbi:MAG: type II toxin-antitoxin system RelE/ParE family toxin [Rickettsiales bacterium]|nr:type II toxin-antitoxin system RelE/ParE family toxin [Rickettsiales bacterium]